MSLVLRPGASAAEPIVVVRSEAKGWPQFRGPARDARCEERGLLSSWPEAGPPVVCNMTNLGRGYSSPVFADQMLFVTGDFTDHLEILAGTAEGRVVWRATNGASWTGQYPGARSSVTYDDGRIYHQNAHGRLAALDARSGTEVWSTELLERFGGQNITWGLSEAVVVDAAAVYATVGGRDAFFAAFDKKTGALRWKSEPLFDSAGDKDRESASYASPILVRFSGRRLLIGCSRRHLVCADAETGTIQWAKRIPTAFDTIAMQPVVVNDGIFIAAPRSDGGRCFQLLPHDASSGLINVRETWRTKLDTLQGGVVFHDGKLFGSYYMDRKGWVALDAQSGEPVYQLPDYVKGSILLAEGKLYMLCEDGWMLLSEAREDRFEILSRFRFVQSKERDVWAHPVIYGGRLYLRYHDRMAAFDIRSHSKPGTK